MKRPQIDETTKVATLLEHFPELEDVLIAMAPPFAKLKNPILRRGVAKVASLKQAATVARIPVVDVVNELRLAVGQDPMAADEVDDTDSYLTERPDWFHDERVVESIDESKADPNVMPLKPLILKSVKLEPGQIVELVTTFLPVPGIDLMRKKGFLTWSTEDASGTVRNYFAKSPE